MTAETLGSIAVCMGMVSLAVSVASANRAAHREVSRTRAATATVATERWLQPEDREWLRRHGTLFPNDREDPNR